MWTLFWDMHSGGGQKEKWTKIYIEAPEDEARVVFYNRFGHNPDRVTCTCCGEDYAVYESEDFAQASAYHRNCKWNKGGYIEEQNDEYKHIYSEEEWPPEHARYMTVEEYINQPDVLIIKAEQILPEEREGDVPMQGYVWQG